MQVAELIDRAKAVTGSDAKTGFTLGVAPTVVSEWRRGKRTCTIETRIKLAALAGLDPRVATDPYVLETLQGTPWAEAARKAMGKLAAGVAGTFFTWGLTTGDAHAAVMHQLSANGAGSLRDILAGLATMYIMSNCMRGLCARLPGCVQW